MRGPMRAGSGTRRRSGSRRGGRSRRGRTAQRGPAPVLRVSREQAGRANEWIKGKRPLRGRFSSFFMGWRRGRAASEKVPRRPGWKAVVSGRAERARAVLRVSREQAGAWGRKAEVSDRAERTRAGASGEPGAGRGRANEWIKGKRPRKGRFSSFFMGWRRSYGRQVARAAGRHPGRRPAIRAWPATMRSAAWSAWRRSCSGPRW